MSRFAPFEWIVAMRFLGDGRLQTLLTLFGVAIGVGVIVFMSALLSAIQSNMIRRTLSTQPHIQVLPREEIARSLRLADNALILPSVQKPVQRTRSIDQWQALMAVLDRWPQVTNVSPTASGSAIAVRGEASRGISLIGVEPSRYFRIVDLPEKIVQGQARLGAQDVVIGTELGIEFGIAVGDKLRLTTASGGAANLTISGIVDLGNKGANLRNVYVSLRTAQSQLNLPGGVSSLDIQVEDPWTAENIANAVRQATGIKAESWIGTNQQFFQAINAQALSNTTIRVFVALSAALGIASVLVVSVVQRQREIGILRAMGATRAQILRLFLLQGAVIGLVGSLIGSGLAWGAVQVWLQATRNADGTALFEITVEPPIVAIAAVTATLVGVLAAALPAFSAAKLDPVVAIRG